MGHMVEVVFDVVVFGNELVAFVLVEIGFVEQINGLQGFKVGVNHGFDHVAVVVDWVAVEIEVDAVVFMVWGVVELVCMRRGSNQLLNMRIGSHGSLFSLIGPHA